jgi:hypothetical protein
MQFFIVVIAATSRFAAYESQKQNYLGAFARSAPTLADRLSWMTQAMILIG